MKKSLVTLAAFLFLAQTAVSTPIRPENLSVFLISIDGLRPDAIDAAFTPHLDSLVARGCEAIDARTIVPSYTLPSHTSMLTGLSYAQHGVNWNSYQPRRGIIPHRTILSLAAESGIRSDMMVGKSKLRHLNQGHENFFFKLSSKRTTTITRHMLARIDNAGLAPLTFLHFGDTDSKGHSYGWMSPRYLEAVEQVDVALGMLFAKIESLGLTEQVIWLVTADHGGSGTKHGGSQDEHTRIPWIIAGPGIKQGKLLENPVQTFDTAATVLKLLNITWPAAWSGKPVLEVFENL